MTPGMPIKRAADGSDRTRVLVIDDSRDAADTLQVLLELDGYAVEVAYDGRRGLEAAARFRPDVVLCDISLPGLDGYGVARALREDEELRDTFLVAFSGYSDDEDRARSLGHGFDAHLAKPIEIEDLKVLVTRGRPKGAR